MTDQPQGQQPEPTNSVTNVSGGVNANAERIDIGADVVGRDKIVHIEHYHAGGEATSSKPKIYHNLPQPDYGQFIGREPELKRVHELLSPNSRHFVVTIDGIGGIGKSALALEVAHHYLRNFDRIPSVERFEAIIWASAKQTVLTVDGIVHRRQVLRTLDDIYTIIAVVLRREDITRARREEQPETVRNALAQQRALLVIDNLETVDDETVMEFLRELPAPTKAVVTTRHRIDVAYPVRLAGMPSEDAMLMIGQECAKKSVRMSEEEARRLYRRTGGVPLAFVWSIAQMGMGHTVDQVLTRLGQPSSDIARFCFENVLESIEDKPAGKILTVTSLFATDASRDALGYIAELPELDRDDGLVNLEKLSLTNRVGSRFSVLPLTRQYVLARLLAHTTTELKYRGRQADYYIRMINQHKWGSASSRALIDEELFNISAVLNHLIAQGEFLTVVEIFNGYYPFLWRQGHWSQGIELLQQVLVWAENNKREDIEARCNHWLGRLYLYQHQFEEAERRLLYASKQYATSDWQWISVRTYLAQTLLRQNRTVESRRILQDALPIALERKDYRGATRLYNALAEAAIRETSLTEALNWIDTGYGLAEGRNEQTTVLGQNYYLRGILERLKMNYEAAKEWVTKYKEIAEREGFLQESAQSGLELARIACAARDSVEAVRKVEEVKTVFERLGMTQEMRECQEIYAACVPAET